MTIVRGNKRSNDQSAPDVLPPAKRRSTFQVELIGVDITVLAEFVRLLDEDNSDELIPSALSAPSLLNVVSFLDSANERSSSELTTIYRALYIIILYANQHSSISAYRTTALSLCDGIMEDARLSSCLYGLKSKHGVETIKTALCLLAAMVTVSTDVARGLLHCLDFTRKDLVDCSHRRNKLDQHDVRSCFINLIGSFLFTDSILIMKELIDKKNALSLVVRESFADKYANVILIIHMLQKLAEDRRVSKTQKIRIFNQHSLQQLLRLYSWRGEALTVAEASARSGLDIDEEQLTSVRTQLHKLMSTLHTSVRYGIVFNDHDRGLDSRLPNDIILRSLTSPPMASAHTDQLLCDLVASGLTACPDIMDAYLIHLSPYLQPRENSENWSLAMDLVCQIFDRSQRHVATRVTGLIDQGLTPQQLCAKLLPTCLPPPKVNTVIVEALNFNQATAVMDKAKVLMSILKTGFSILLTWLSTSDKCSTIAEQLKQELRRLGPERLPNTKYVRRFDKLFDRDVWDPEVLADQILPPPAASGSQEAEDAAVQVEPNDEFSQFLKLSKEELYHLERQELRTLPKGLYKILKLLHAGEWSVEGRDLSKARKYVGRLDAVLDDCIGDNFGMPAVHTCLAHALQLPRQEDSNPTGKLVEAKRVLKLLVRHGDLPGTLLFSTDAQQPQSSTLDVKHILRLRDCLFSVLLEIARQAPKAMGKRIPIPWLLVAYSASMSTTDRKILNILYFLDSRTRFSLLSAFSTGTGGPSPPPVWGSALLKHYQFSTNQHGTGLQPPVVCRLPSISTLFTMFNEDQVLRTALAFPVRRVWLGQQLVSNAVKDYSADLLDPCFVLHVVYHFLSQYKEVRADPLSHGRAVLDGFLRTLFTRHFLSLAVAGLSSYSRHLRSLARTIIAEYHDLALAWQPIHSEKKEKTIGKPVDGVAAAKLFPECAQVRFVLVLLRNSLATGGGSALGGHGRKKWMFASPADTGGRLSSVLANFFVRALQIVAKPEHHMYSAIWNCLLAKPALDLSHVPDFLRLFFSTNNKFRLERQWITHLCAESLRDPSDYLVLEHSRVYKHVLVSYASPTSDVLFQLAVLQLLVNTTAQPRLVHALIRFHCIPLWLWRNALSPCSPAHIQRFGSIIKNMLCALRKDGRVADSLALNVMEQLHTEFRKTYIPTEAARVDSNADDDTLVTKVKADSSEPVCIDVT